MKVGEVFDDFVVILMTICACLEMFSRVDAASVSGLLRGLKVTLHGMASLFYHWLRLNCIVANCGISSSPASTAAGFFFVFKARILPGPPLQRLDVVFKAPFLGGIPRFSFPHLSHFSGAL